MAFFTPRYYIPSYKIKVSATDGVAGYLSDKIVAGSGITITKLTSGGVETLSIASSGGGGTPAGSSTYVQYNNAGAFGASANYTFDPSANTNTIKAKAGQSANIWQVKDGSGTAQTYTDSSATLNFGNNPIFHNIAGGSLLGLTNSNVLQGISSLVNIFYSPGASQLLAVPSGYPNTGVYQFRNGSGLFDANTHALQNSDFSSTFLGTADLPGTPGSFNPAIVYADSGVYTTGYPVNGVARGYKLYAEKIDPSTNAGYFSPTPAYITVTDNNSSLSCPVVSTLNFLTENTGTGSYVCNGQSISYYVWSYEYENGNIVFAGSPLSAGMTDSVNDGVTNFSNQIDWVAPSFNPSATTVGYIIQRSINGAGYNDWIDVGNITDYTDDGSNSGWNIGTSPTLTPTAVPNFFQVPITWAAVTGAVNYKLFYSPNNFSPITTGSPSISTAVDFGFSGYTNQTINYQAFFYQTISGQNIWCSSGSFSSASDFSANPFAVDITLTAPSIDPGATGSGFLILRDTGSGYTDYLFQPATFIDTNSGWTTGTIDTSITSGILKFSILTGNTTSFQDTGAISWTNNYTVTPTQAGPFGATIGGSNYGLNTNGPMEVNSNYVLPVASPGSSNKLPISTSASAMTWIDYNLNTIAGQINSSQIAFGSGTGNIVNYGSNLNTTPGFTFDIGLLYHTQRVPTVLTFEAGFQNGPSATGAYWQLYCPSADLSWYNIQGSYGEWMHVSNTDRKVTFPVGKINSPLPTSSAGLATGDWWCDTTGGLNIIKIK